MNWGLILGFSVLGALAFLAGLRWAIHKFCELIDE
jgi:hypothetical protein